eukprot:jgi/Chlat1/3930/Chrsp26S04192
MAQARKTTSRTGSAQQEDDEDDHDEPDGEDAVKIIWGKKAHRTDDRQYYHACLRSKPGRPKQKIKVFDCVHLVSDSKLPFVWRITSMWEELKGTDKGQRMMTGRWFFRPTDIDKQYFSSHPDRKPHAKEIFLAADDKAEVDVNSMEVIIKRVLVACTWEHLSHDNIPVVPPGKQMTDYVDYFFRCAWHDKRKQMVSLHGLYRDHKDHVVNPPHLLQLVQKKCGSGAQVEAKVHQTASGMKDTQSPKPGLPEDGVAGGNKTAVSKSSQQDADAHASTKPASVTIKDTAKPLAANTGSPEPLARTTSGLKSAAVVPSQSISVVKDMSFAPKTEPSSGPSVSVPGSAVTMSNNQVARAVSTPILDVKLARSTSIAKVRTLVLGNSDTKQDMSITSAQAPSAAFEQPALTAANEPSRPHRSSNHLLKPSARLLKGLPALKKIKGEKRKAVGVPSKELPKIPKLSRKPEGQAANETLAVPSVAAGMETSQSTGTVLSSKPGVSSKLDEVSVKQTTNHQDTSGNISLPLEASKLLPLPPHLLPKYAQASRVLLVSNLCKGVDSNQLWEAFAAACTGVEDAALLPDLWHDAFACAQGYVVFANAAAAEQANTMLNSKLLLLDPSARPVLVGKPEDYGLKNEGFHFVGHFPAQLFTGTRIGTPHDFGSIAAHFAQHNTIEFGLALQWRHLLEQQTRARYLLAQEHLQEQTGVLQRLSLVMEETV